MRIYGAIAALSVVTSCGGGGGGNNITVPVAAAIGGVPQLALHPQAGLRVSMTQLAVSKGFVQTPGQILPTVIGLAASPTKISGLDPIAMTLISGTESSMILTREL